MSTPILQIVVFIQFPPHYLLQMEHIDNVVGIAGGPNKTEVIQAALLGKKINVLISDSITAQKASRSGLILLIY